MRYERKYKVDNIALSVVLQTLKLHPASFRKIYPNRRVNNIYFDTPDYNTFQDNVDGVANRKKYRVRWYNDNPTDIQNPKFEIKIKSNQLGDKKIFPVQSFKINQTTNLQNEVLAHCNNCIALSPTLFNTYNRAYFGTSNGKFRITIDTNLAYHSMMNAHVFSQFSHKEDGVVIELKYEEEYDDEAQFVMQHLGWRQTKSSKYVSGMLWATS